MVIGRVSTIGEICRDILNRLSVSDVDMKFNRYVVCLQERRNELLGDAIFNVTNPKIDLII